MNHKAIANISLLFLIGFLSLTPIGIGALFFRSWWPIPKGTTLLIEGVFSLCGLLVVSGNVL